MKMFRFFYLLLLMPLFFASCEKTITTPLEEDDDEVVDNAGTDSDDYQNDKDTNGTDGDTDSPASGIEAGDTVNVATFRQADITYSVYVRGYIVGAATGKYNQMRYQFTPPFSYDTAILMADTKTADSTDEVISVCIRNGSGSPREKLNLKDHPENLGREIVVYGMQDTYLKLPGISELRAWSLY